MKKINNKKRLQVLKVLLIIAVLLFLIFATLKLFPLISKLSNESTRDIAKQEISDLGILGIFLVILLQVIQIVVAVIPGQPMEIITGMLYGTWGGMVVCLLGIFLGTAIVFVIVRKLGLKFVNVFFKKEEVNKIRKSKIYKNPRSLEILMLIIFCIPMIPKDIFIYLGGISPVETKRFLAIATVGRIPGLFLTVFAGNRLSEGNIRIVVILSIIIVAVAIVGYCISQKFQKKLEEKVSKA